MKLRSIATSLFAALTLASFTCIPTFAASPSGGVRVVIPHKIHGVILSVAADGMSLQFQRRNGILTTVDLTEAQANKATGLLPVGDAVVIFGYRNPDGTFHAQNVGHASQNATEWNADNP